MGCTNHSLSSKSTATATTITTAAVATTTTTTTPTMMDASVNHLMNFHSNVMFLSGVAVISMFPDLFHQKG
jgi:hypothetical protein